MPRMLILVCALAGLAAWPLGHAETRGPAPLAAPAKTEGKLYAGSYALLVGVGQYEDAHWPGLDSISKELDEIAALLEDQGFTVVRVDNPGKSQLQAEIEKFIYQYGIAPSKNRLLFYFAGHGDTLDGEGYSKSFSCV